MPLEYLKPCSSAAAAAASALAGGAAAGGQRPPKRSAPEGSSQVGDGWMHARAGWPVTGRRFLSLSGQTSDTCTRVPMPMPVTMQVKEFVIPDHLRLLPTDSEEDKARKRKKVKHLKAQWKQRHAGALEAQEEAQAGGGGSWKDYLKSKKKGGAAKGLGALKKGSIFASPDTVGGESRAYAWLACSVGGWHISYMLI